jgi:hypothetical protein
MGKGKNDPSPHFSMTISHWALFLYLFPWTALHAVIQWDASPTTLSNSGVNASAQSVKMDPQGNCVAIWLEGFTLQAAIKPLNGSWSAISTISNSGAAQPQLGMDGSGNAIAIWSQNGIIQSSNLPLNGTWSTPLTLSSTGASSAQISVDSSGNAAAVWQRNNLIESSILLSGGSWPSLPTIISSDEASQPQVAIGGGTIVAVWQTSTAAIQSATCTLNGSWSAPTTISTSLETCITPMIVVDLNGNAVATWISYLLSDGVYSNVYGQSAALPTSGSWSAPTIITPVSIANPSQIVSNLSIDAEGNALAVGTLSFDGASFYCGSTTLPFKQTWNVPLTFVAVNYYAYAINAVFYAVGRPIAAWMFQDPTSSNLTIQACDGNIFSSKIQWGAPLTLAAGASNAYPVIAAASTSDTINAIVLWENWNGSNAVIQASFGTGTILQPPSNLSLVQEMNNFNLFNEYYNVVSWQPSPSPEARGYIIYRNGLLIGMQSSSQLSFSDHNRIPGESDTYAITSYDQFLLESDQAIIVSNQ